jgi:hypothetical protein
MHARPRDETPDRVMRTARPYACSRVSSDHPTPPRQSHRPSARVNAHICRSVFGNAHRRLHKTSREERCRARPNGTYALVALDTQNAGSMCVGEALRGRVVLCVPLEYSGFGGRP